MRGQREYKIMFLQFPLPCMAKQANFVKFCWGQQRVQTNLHPKTVQRLRRTPVKLRSDYRTHEHREMPPYALNSVRLAATSLLTRCWLE